VLVRPAGLLDVVLEKLNLDRRADARPVQAAAQFPTVSLDVNSSYHVYMNEQPQVKSGLVLRALPLDLTEALPIALKPGESVSVPFASMEAGVLSGVAEDGAALSISAGSPVIPPENKHFRRRPTGHEDRLRRRVAPHRLHPKHFCKDSHRLAPPRARATRLRYAAASGLGGVARAASQVSCLERERAALLRSGARRSQDV
jgi:hypothetical protein